MSQSDSQTGWKSQAGYIWSVLGSAVGFANILSFSAQAYKNGGGAFLIPYFLALFVLGIPLLILEGVIGQKTKLPLVGAYGQVWGRAGKILGWLAVLACLSIGGFYIVLTGYSLAYTAFSAVGAIPEDSKTFFLEKFLQLSPSLTEFGGFSLPVMIPTIATGALVWFVMSRSVRDGIEKICSIFMPLLVVIMVLFAVLATCLPGGLQGWIRYLTPDFSRLSEPSLWRDVFGQLFFSLSLGLGIIVGYSRHTKETINIRKALLYVALGDFFVSFISGAAIFAALSHISFTLGVSFESILATDSTFEIGFIIFPKILGTLGILAKPLGAIFFFCVFIAGITGVFSIVESVAGNVEVELKMTRKRAVLVSLSAILGLAALFSMGNASHLIDALAPMVIGTNMLIGGLILIAIFLFASKEISQDEIWKNGPNRFFLRYIAPLILAVILTGNLIEEFQSFNLAIAIRWGWFLLALGAAATLSLRKPRVVHVQV